MKKLFNVSGILSGVGHLRKTHRILVPAMAALSAVLVMAVVVFAAVVQFTLSVSSTVTIAPFVPSGGVGGGTGSASYAIAVYTDVSLSDASRLTTISSYNWGTLAKGTSKSINFYVKNIGNQPIATVTTGLGGSVPDGLSISGATASTLAVNDTVTLAVTLSLTSGSTATEVATPGFTTNFIAWS